MIRILICGSVLTPDDKIEKCKKAVVVIEHRKSAAKD